MKTLAQLIEAQKCRKGKADGTTRKGAYWLVKADDLGEKVSLEITIRSWGGDGIGQSRADLRNYLQFRHFRNGNACAMVRRHSWHQNDGHRDTYTMIPALMDCTTVEQAIVALKGVKTDPCDHYHSSPENVYSDNFEKDLTGWLVALGMTEMEPAPDDNEDPETAA